MAFDAETRGAPIDLRPGHQPERSADGHSKRGLGRGISRWHLVSRDGGVTWSFAAIDPSFDGYRPFLAGVGHDDAVFVYGGVRAYRTDDLGATWETLGFTEPVEYLDIYRGRTGTLLIKSVPRSIGDYEVSFDGGRNIRRVTFPEASYLTAVDPFDVRTWVLRQGSGVAMTRDGGSTFQFQDLGEYPRAVAFHPRRRSQLYVLDTGTLWVSTNGGRSLEPRPLPERADWSDLTFDPCDDSTIYAWGNHRLVRSVDSGRSWTDVSQLPQGVSIVQIEPLRGSCELSVRTEWGPYVLGQQADLWTPAGHGLPAVVLGVAWDPHNEGRVITRTSRLMFSDDDGRSWRRLRTVPASFVDAVLVGRSSRILAIDFSLRILVSADLGQTFRPVPDAPWPAYTFRTDPFDPTRLLVKKLGNTDSWYESTNSGITFSPLDTETEIGQLAYSSRRAGQLLGWRVEDSRLLVSYDYGRTFEAGGRLPLFFDEDGLLRVGPRGAIYAVSTIVRAELFRSFDGGATFEDVEMPFDSVPESNSKLWRELRSIVEVFEAEGADDNSGERQ